MVHMLEPGASIEQRRLILEADCIRFLGSAVPPSLSTPAMILWMEMAARDLVKPALEAGQDTVGVHVDVEHLAASPVGAQVSFRAKLASVDDRRLTFEVEALDRDEVVGRGRHVRFVIDVERFAKRLEKRFASR
jgi:predicted thioesterase